MSPIMVGSSEGTGEKVPVGTMLAVLAGVFDLGVRIHPQYGPRREVCLWWESQKRDSKGRQFGVRDVVGANLSEKGHLRKRVEALLGRPISEAESKGLDLTTLIGRSCFITMTPPKKNPQGYPYVEGAVPVPDGFPANLKIEGDYREPPPFVKKVIESNAAAIRAGNAGAGPVPGTNARTAPPVNPAASALAAAVGGTVVAGGTREPGSDDAPF